MLAGFSMAGFGPTKLVYSWRNPNAPGGPFKNIMVLALNGQAANRAQFEDVLTAAITQSGVQAVQSYSLIPRPNLTPINMDNLRNVVQGQGFDAVLVSRIVQYHKTVHEVQDPIFPLEPYYATFYGFYGYASPMVYTPTYLQTEQKAQVETKLLCDVNARWCAGVDWNQRHGESSLSERCNQRHRQAGGARITKEQLDLTVSVKFQILVGRRCK